MGKIRDVESPDEFQDVIDSAGDQLVVADFWASWCGPCRLMGPHFHKIAEEAEFDDVIFIKIDVDELGELAEEWEIQCMPTFMFIKNGEKIDEMAGANKEKLRELLMKHK